MQLRAALADRAHIVACNPEASAAAVATVLASSSMNSGRGCGSEAGRKDTALRDASMPSGNSDSHIVHARRGRARFRASHSSLLAKWPGGPARPSSASLVVAHAVTSPSSDGSNGSRARTSLGRERKAAQIASRALCTAVSSGVTRFSKASDTPSCTLRNKTTTLGSVTALLQLDRTMLLI